MTAVMGTYTENELLIPDGTTVYRGWAYADNTGLGGELTDGAEYRFEIPTYLNSISNFGKPNSDRDFFEGNPMFFENILGPGSLSGRLVSSGFGVSDKVGDLQWYDFTVNQGAPAGQGNFELGLDTGLLDPDGGQQPIAIQNSPFYIVQKGDADANGIVDAIDLSLVRENFGLGGGWKQGNFNFDGSIDASDLSNVREFFGSTVNPGIEVIPIGNEIPEPSSVFLAGTLAGVVAGNYLGRSVGKIYDEVRCGFDKIRRFFIRGLEERL
jgi:hypothetical protein